MLINLFIVVIANVQKKKIRKMPIFQKLTLFIFSIAFVLIFSTTTSPLFPNFWGFDSAVFQFVGKSWAKGYLPYVDLFDHKGPFTYLVNAIGYSIGGVWIVQVFFLFFTVLGVYDLVSNSFTSKKWRFISTLSFFIIFVGYYQKGNLTEEYCLPFLMWSMSKQLEYFKNNNIIHKPIYAFLYGLTFGVCAMTRITNAVIVCSFVLAISINLLIKKEYKNLGMNAIVFLLGVAFVVAPFVIYFSVHDALPNMMYGTFIYNIMYAKDQLSTPNFSLSLGLFKLLKFIISSIAHYSIFVFMIIVAIFEIKNKNYIYAFGIILSVTLSTYTCVIIAEYTNYAIIAIPYYFLFICSFIDVRCDDVFRKTVIILYCGIFVLCSSYGFVSYAISDFKKQIKGECCGEQLPIKILNDIPKEDRDSIVGYNIVIETYMAWDIMPKYPYFVLQDWQGKRSEDLMNRIRKKFMSCEAKWIVTKSEENGISDILDKSYTIINTYDHIGENWSLYRLK